MELAQPNDIFVSITTVQRTICVSASSQGISATSFFFRVCRFRKKKIISFDFMAILCNFYNNAKTPPPLKLFITYFQHRIRKSRSLFCNCTQNRWCTCINIHIRWFDVSLHCIYENRLSTRKDVLLIRIVQRTMHNVINDTKDTSHRSSPHEAYTAFRKPIKVICKCINNRSYTARARLTLVSRCYIELLVCIFYLALFSSLLFFLHTTQCIQYQKKSDFVYTWRKREIEKELMFKKEYIGYGVCIGHSINIMLLLTFLALRKYS